MDVVPVELEPVLTCSMTAALASAMDVTIL